MSYDPNWFFLLVVLVIVVLWKIYFFVKKDKIDIVIPVSPNILFLTYLKYFFQLVIVAILLALPLNIWFVKWVEIFKEKLLNIEILFDVSLSMTAKDFEPSRFFVAKKSVIDFVSWLTWSNVWLITFSGIPFVYSPMSTDINSLTSKLNDMNMADFPPSIDFVWTAIGDAILLWISEISKFTNQDNDKPGIIILVTDGDSNKWIDPIEAAQISSSSNIPIFTLWVWKEDFLVWHDNYGNNPVITSLDTKVLKEISDSTSWKFQRVLTINDFDKILEEITVYIKWFEKNKKIIKYNYINSYLIVILIMIVIVYIGIFRI